MSSKLFLRPAPIGSSNRSDSKFRLWTAPELWIQIGVFSIGKSPNLKSAINYDHAAILNFHIPNSLKKSRSPNLNILFLFVTLRDRLQSDSTVSHISLSRKISPWTSPSQSHELCKLPRSYDSVFCKHARVYWRKNRSRSVWNYDHPSGPGRNAADRQTLRFSAMMMFSLRLDSV